MKYNLSDSYGKFKDKITKDLRLDVIFNNSDIWLSLFYILIAAFFDYQLYTAISSIIFFRMAISWYFIVLGLVQVYK